MVTNQHADPVHRFFFFGFFFYEYYQVLFQRACRCSVLMLMDHLSSSRSLISSPYLPHHFIWPKGNNKSLIHYPLTQAAMRKYLITANKLNFNHLILLQGCTAHYTEEAITHVPLILHLLCAFQSEKTYLNYSYCVPSFNDFFDDKNTSLGQIRLFWPQTHTLHLLAFSFMSWLLIDITQFLTSTIPFLKSLILVPPIDHI